MTTTKNNEHNKLNFSSEREQSQACLNSAEHEKNQGRKVLNVPNLRFPEFQGEWEKCILGDITENFNLRNKDKIQYPMFSVTNDRGFVPQSEQFEGRDMVGEDIKAYKIIHTNDFAYNPARINVGSIAIYTGEKPCMISSLYVCFKTTKEVNNEWLMQLLKTPKMNYYYNVNAEGGVRVYLFYPNFARIRMSIPKIEEQKKIAKLLNLLDERIATQNKIIEDLKKLKSAIIENVFDDKHSERLQLDNVGSYIRGLTYSSNDVVEHGGTLVMRSNNIVNGSLLDYNNNVVFVNKQMSAEQQLQNGDIVICMANGSSSLVGKSSFYDGNCHSPITVGAFCGIYRSKEPIVKWLFQTNKYRRYIWNSLQGGNGAIANLNGEDILNMSFSIPNAPIKDTCVKMLTSVDSALGNNMSLCALYTLQKQHLLRQMFI